MSQTEQERSHLIDEYKTSDPIDALAFAMSKIDEPHRHHRHCIHNLSVEEQWEHWRFNIDGEKATDEQMNLMGFYREQIVSITPGEWEIDVPDLDYSRLVDPTTEEER